MGMVNGATRANQTDHFLPSYLDFSHSGWRDASIMYKGSPEMDIQLQQQRCTS